MSELEKATYDRGFYNGIREARQIFAKHLNVSTSTDEVKWDNVSKTEILSEIDNFMTKNEAYPQPQLTIPKSIADELDGAFAGIDATDIGYVLDQTGPYGSRAFVNYYFKNKNIIALYLAGKALGVDLVKVVEND